MTDIHANVRKCSAPGRIDAKLKNMTLSADACYKAVLAHDHRFDGLFFTCVQSTNIYCRPICPAVTPRREHCTFVSTAAKAEALGYRPCLRCRPEYAPGTTETSLTAAESLAHHIDQTLMADATFSSIAPSFGVSERHLRRTFKEAFGIEPHQYLITRRLLFAKQLLQDTALTTANIAFAAGFGSVGRLTITMKKAYGFTPQQLRKNAPRDSQQSLELKTAYRPPFDWESILTFLAGRATPNERIEDGAYYRVVENGLEIRVSHLPEKSLLIVTIPAELSKQAYQLVRRVRKLFDLDADPQAISQVLQQNSYIAPLIRQYPGIRTPGCWDEFEMLLRVIIGQQISVAGATTVMSRLINRVGITPAAIAASSVDTIAGIGMPGKRAQTILTCGRLVQSGQLQLQESNPTRLYNQLIGIPGIGPWTAEYIKMRALHWPDSLPVEDLGLQKALIPGQKVTKKILSSSLQTASPWRSYATMLLWKSLENNGG